MILIPFSFNFVLILLAEKLILVTLIASHCSMKSGCILTYHLERTYCFPAFQKELDMSVETPQEPVKINQKSTQSGPTVFN